MARYNSTILWSLASSTTLTTASEVLSDEFTYDSTTYAARLQVKADNQGTPATGDVVNVKILYSMDGTLFDTTEHADVFATLDTYPTNTPGEDPATKSAIIDAIPKKFKISVTAPQAAGAGNDIVVSAIICEQRPT